ncbi:MAG TPA: hypothetical protein VHC19_12780 [Pirellulales bacterium]|jgi:hypothetical protein|nr:hypothetical protein [Pirellulales bacterium]
MKIGGARDVKNPFDGNLTGFQVKMALKRLALAQGDGEEEVPLAPVAIYEIGLGEKYMKMHGGRDS